MGFGMAVLGGFLGGVWHGFGGWSSLLDLSLAAGLTILLGVLLPRPPVEGVKCADVSTRR